MEVGVRRPERLYRPVIGVRVFSEDAQSSALLEWVDLAGLRSVRAEFIEGLGRQVGKLRFDAYS